MTDDVKKAPTKVSFAMEANAKINRLIDWVIENSPDKEHPLAHSDFADVREQFYKIACGIDMLETEPEPSEGGAQYVNVTPAPWP